LIQARYGWTDDEVLEIPFERFQQLLRVASRALAKQKKDAFEYAAFTGWHTIASKELPWQKYRKDLGLDKPVEFVTAKLEKPTIAEIMAETDRIMAADLAEMATEKLRQGG
jgi:hypothetical protein